MNNEYIKEDQKEIQVIVFKLGKEEYAIPITCVQEIIMMQTATQLPNTPQFVEGVINLRGRVIPIIDGRKKFQFEIDNADSSESKIMILELAHTIGLIVDAVTEVAYLRNKDIEEPPTDMSEDAGFLWGIGKYKDRLILLVDPKRFLTVEEADKLQNFKSAPSQDTPDNENLAIAT